MTQETYDLTGVKHFPFPHPVRYPAQITVEVLPGGVVPPAEYEVIGYGPDATKVTIHYPNAPGASAGAKLVITRFTQPGRVADFPDDEGVTARGLNAEFDNVYQSVQDFSAQLEARVDAIIEVEVPLRVDAYLDEHLPPRVEQELLPYVEQAEIARDEAVEAADLAEDYRDQIAAFGGYYENAAAGIADTSDGDIFSVVNDPIPGRATIYRNDAGSAEVITTYILATGTAAVLAATIAELRELESTDRAVQVLGYYAPGDEGGGTFLWAPQDTSDDNGGTVIKPNHVDQADPGRWRAQYTGRIDARRFGLRSVDGVSAYAAENLDAMDRLTTACAAWEIPEGEYVIGGDIGITTMSEIFIGRAAVVRLADAAEIRHFRINRQDTARRTGVFVFEPSSEGSVFETHGLIDGNQNEQGPQGGRNTAISAIQVWGADNLKIEGKVRAVNASSALHIIDSRESTFDEVWVEGDVVVGPVEGMTGVALEGCDKVTGTLIVANDVTEAIDFNNGNSDCFVEYVFADGVTEEVVDLNGSWRCGVGTLSARNCKRVWLSGPDSGARYTERQLDLVGHYRVGTANLLIDGDNEQELFIQFFHGPGSGAGIGLEFENIDVRVTADADPSLMPTELVGIREWNAGKGRIRVRSLVETQHAVTIHGMADCDLELNVTAPVPSGRSIVRITGGTGANVIHSALIQQPKGSSPTGRTGLSIEHRQGIGHYALINSHHIPGAYVETPITASGRVRVPMHPVSAVDAGRVTWHEGHQVTIPAGGYHTVFDINGPAALLGGAVNGVHVGYRLTVDGVVVADLTNLAAGRDTADDGFTTAPVLPAQAFGSMKLEVVNNRGSANEIGWRVATRNNLA